MIIDDDKSQKLITLAFNAGQEIIRIYNKIESRTRTVQNLKYIIHNTFSKTFSVQKLYQHRLTTFCHQK